MPQTRDQQLAHSARAEKAAQWMRDELGRNDGTLTQDQAWKGVRERFGAELALNSASDSWLSKSVLSAFRKLTPDVVWDPAGRSWRNQKRGDAMANGARIVGSKVKS
jgi:hypothetical protein